jgi:tetratricopeptide (TPR) repeat protein
MQGRLAETHKTIEAIRTSLAPMPEMAGGWEMYVAFIEMRMKMWDELLATPKPTDHNPLFTAMWRYGRAIGFLGKGQRAEARREHQEFQELRTKIDRNMPWGANRIGEVMDLAGTVLNARLESDPATVIAHWRKAVDMQDQLTYFEPPAWYYPVRESLGAALLRFGNPAAAEMAFREGLRRSPNNGRMLFGLRESLRAQRKIDEMAWVEREFQSAWKNADVQLRIEDL